MAEAAVLCFVTLAPALVLASLRRASWVAESLAMVAVLTALLALTGYAYGVRGLYSIGLYKGIAVHAALAFFVLALGVLLVCGGSFSRLIVSDTAGGVVARWFLPIALGVPLVLGWLRLVGQRAGLYGTDFGAALYSVSSIVLLVAILWPIALRLMRTDEQRKRNDQALRETEERYRQIVETTAEGIWTYDERLTTLFVNQRMPEMLGYSAEEMIGRPALDFFAPDSRAAGEANVAKRRRGIGERVEYRFKKKDGSILLASAAVTPRTDAAGRFVGSVALVTDITERKRAETVLHEREEMLSSIYDAAAEAIFHLHIEPDGRYRFASVNPAFCATTGLTAGQVAGQWVNDVVPEPSLSMVLAKYAEAIRDRKVVRWEETSTYPTGTLTGEVSVSPVFDASGDCTHLVGVVHDITERKRVEQELLNRTEELARSNRELEQFAYVASHDLQEPLRMVASYTQLLGRRYEGKLDADADEFIAFAVEGATRMQAMIGDLLAYSRLGSKDSPMGPVDCQSVMARTLANLGPTIEESHALVTSDPLPTVPASETEVVQLLQNLISNAIKFRSEGSPVVVHVSAKRSGAEWIFSVRDNGIGIPPEHRDRIFVIFQRLNPRDRYPGTGIGLAICKKIVERHRGRIWVESEPGGGSTFLFTIPETRRATP